MGIGPSPPGFSSVRPPAHARAPPGLLSPDQPPVKVMEDLKVARETVSLFEEVLGSISEEGDLEAEHVKEVAERCQALQSRLAGMVQYVSDEAVLAAALELHDDAVKMLEKHRAMLEGRRGPAGAPSSGSMQQKKETAAASAVGPIPAPSGPGGAAVAAAASGTVATTIAVPPKQPILGKQPAAPSADLLMDLDWNPAPESPSSSSSAPAFVDPFHPPVAAPLPKLNNPFAPAPPGTAPPSKLPPLVVPQPVAAPLAPAVAPLPAPAAVAQPAPSPAAGGSGNPFAAGAAFASVAVPFAPPPPPPPVTINPFPSQGVHYTSGPLSAVAPPAFGGGPSQTLSMSPGRTDPFATFTPGGMLPTSQHSFDAFGDLVAMQPKKKVEAPPPPK
jgi:hypothetical protein